MNRSGDGWTTCGRGHRHWGRFGAAGLLLRRAAPSTGAAGTDEVALQLRVGWSHHGGTWGIPGGARDEHESVVEAALREAAEEAAVDGATLEVQAVSVADHGGWSYSTVIARAGPETTVRATSPESDDVAWFGVDAVADRDLHPGFAASWPGLKDLPSAPELVIDAANVVGSRPDGWWRDRRGATARLRDELARIGADGWPAERMPAPWRAGSTLHWFCPVLMVTEGRARGVDGTGTTTGTERWPAVRIEEADGSGDDAIVDLVARPDAAGRTRLVVTADRELVARVQALGAQTVGPGLILGLTDRPDRPT